MNKKNIVKIRKDINIPPSKEDIDAINQYGQNMDSKCLDCNKPTYYFNQCDNCYSNIITSSKIQY